MSHTMQCVFYDFIMLNRVVGKEQNQNNNNKSPSAEPYINKPFQPLETSLWIEEEFWHERYQGLDTLKNLF